MKQNLTRRIASIFLLAMTAMFGLQCSKSSDAAVSAAGCKFTFKGTSYSYANAICGEPTPGDLDLASTSSNGSQLLTLYKGTIVGIVVALDALNPGTANSTSYNSIVNSHPSTITISGKTWTFSGTVENDDGDTQTISGTCTCTN